MNNYATIQLCGLVHCCPTPVWCNKYLNAAGDAAGMGGKKGSVRFEYIFTISGSTYTHTRRRVTVSLLPNQAHRPSRDTLLPMYLFLRLFL